LAVVLNKRSAFHQIPRRIATDREFGKKDQARAIGLSLMGKFNDLRGVPREIPHGGIDLAQRNLHTISLKAGGVTAKPVSLLCRRYFERSFGSTFFAETAKIQIPCRFAPRNDKEN
jgi:hypothetical protein